MKWKIQNRDAFLVLVILLYRMLVQTSKTNNSNN